MRTIRLYGVLGKTFGRIYRLAVATPKEGLKALCVLVPGLETFINNSKQRGLTFAVFSGKRNITAQELDMDNSAEDIRIAPVIIGSKHGGLFQTILGVALIGASFWMGVGAPASSILFDAGASVALGGVAQMLSPQTQGLANKQDADNRASYAFGGVTNTVAQGYPVALPYGKPRIGGAIVSAGIYVEDHQ